MKIRLILASCAFCLMSALPALCAPPAVADASPAITLQVAAPQTPLPTVLANLAQQTGATILAGSTVTARVGPADYQGDNVGEVLTKLTAGTPGLKWRKVYLPKDAALPSADVLAQQVRTLEAITATGLVVASPTDMIDFSHHADAAAAPPVGMHPVYLVTDENAAAPAAQTTPAPAATAANPVQQASDGMKNVATEFGAMSPQQQSAVLPLMFMQFQRIMQVMDPSVRANLGQMFQQMQQNMQNQNGQDQNGQDMGNGQDQNGQDMGNGQ